MARVMLYTDGGLRDVEVSDRWDRRVVGSYWNAVACYLQDGSTWRLENFHGVEVAGWRLTTDPELLDESTTAGLLDFLIMGEG